MLMESYISCMILFLSFSVNAEDSQLRNVLIDDVADRLSLSNNPLIHVYNYGK